MNEYKNLKAISIPVIMCNSDIDYSMFIITLSKWSFVNDNVN